MHRKPTARELLRKSREQKKQKASNNTIIATTQRTAAAATSALSVQITPSKRKRHNDTNINTDDVLTNKNWDTGRNPPPKQSPEGPPHPVSEQKRPKLVSYSESASESENDSDSERNNKGENVDIPESVVPIDASTGLPAGFFDTDAPVYTDGASDDEGDSGVVGDLKATATLPAQSSSANNNNNNKERLLQSLDDFESEIAGLADEVEESADLPEPSGQEKNTPKDDVDAQGELWRTRAAQLKHLRSIVKDGMQAMDPMEATHGEISPNRMDVSSGSSNIADSDQLSETSGDESEDNDDFAFLTGWRMV